jgi:hypothetical protein
MPNVWVVIGNRGVRKSSTIRALTGVGNVPRVPGPQDSPPLWNVSYANPRAPGQTTFVYPKALQEERLQSQAFIAIVAASGAADVIVALRRHPARGCPTAEAYLAAFQRAGWTIAGCAVLGPNAPPLLIPLPGVPPILIPAAPITPSNAIAAQLRRAWGII